MSDSTVTVKSARGAPAGKWLLLIHQIPPKPDYFRVKVRRRLQRMGAVALKNSVYVLPSRVEAAEDFRWLLREIVAEGGEATLCEAQLVEGITGGELEAMFAAERDAEYAEVVTQVQRLAGQNDDDNDRRAELRAELGRLQRRLEEIADLDYFGAPGRKAAERAITTAEARLKAADGAPPAGSRGGEEMRGLTWVTRQDVYVDRIASAWLIRRFIDPKARFKFTAAESYRPKRGEVRFDMFEAEYTHEGDRCTFETLLHRAGLRDRALRAIGEIVHDIDCKDGKFGREEAPGVAALLKGLARAYPDDAVRLERGAAAFDDLYASLR
jgi:2-hydroxychromene-2-carboxylate isomerase